MGMQSGRFLSTANFDSCAELQSCFSLRRSAFKESDVVPCTMTIMPFHAAGTAGARRGGKTPPPEETFEEAAYLKNLGEKQRSVSIKLADGEIIRGWIEYYDKNMIRVTREGEPNLFIFKHDIMYIAEDGKKK